MESKTRYEVIEKKGKPFLRMWHPIYRERGGYYDSMIYCIKSKPFIRYIGSKWYLEPDMIRQLQALKGARTI